MEKRATTTSEICLKTNKWEVGNNNGSEKIYIMAKPTDERKKHIFQTWVCIAIK